MKINLPSCMIKVDERLIRGKAVTSPIRLYKMKQAGINQIIDLRNTSFVKRPLERLFCKMLGIKYQNCKYPHRLDSLPKPSFFLKVNKLISENTGKSYIHCQHGKRRTGICVAMYERLLNHKPVDTVIRDMVKIGFSDIFTNPNSKRSKKYYNIIKDFMKTYCFPEKK